VELREKIISSTRIAARNLINAFECMSAPRVVCNQSPCCYILDQNAEILIEILST